MKRGVFLLLCLILAAGFAALGVWQAQRLGWKQALIARTEARLRAPPTPPPPPDRWSPDQAYTRVTVAGVFQHEAETLVQAVTERGAGFWVLTPLRTAGGGVILVNRGFVPPERREATTRSAGNPRGEVRVTGLLRASEPHGAFLRANAPEAGRWYSRDVPAIAAARGVGPAAPYFIDAGASPNPGGLPVGGLTIVRFRNDHLAYALTWFGLTGLCLAGAYLVSRRGRSA